MTFLNGVAFGRLVSPEDAEEMDKQYCVEIKKEAIVPAFEHFIKSLNNGK